MPGPRSVNPLFAGGFFLPLFVFPWVVESHHFGKWIFVLATGLLAGMQVLRDSTLLLPRLRGWDLAGLAGLVALALRGAWLGADPAFALAARASFVLIALASFRQFSPLAPEPREATFRDQLGLPWIAASVMVMGLGIVWLPLHSTLGQNNLTGELLALSFAFALARWPRAATSERRLLGAFLFGTICYVFFLYNRSVLVALFAVSIFAAWQSRSGRSRPWVTPALAALSLALPLAGGLGWLFVPDFRELLANKGLESSFRLKIWLNTLLLLRDHPLGVGAGNFPFANLFYHLPGTQVSLDNVLNRTPHNEWLRFAAEDGIPALLLGAGLWLRLLWRKTGIVSWLGMLFVIQCTLQFPFDNPVSFFFLAIFVGYLLAESVPAYAWKPTRAVRALGFCAWAALAGVSGAITTAATLQASAAESEASQTLACRLHPANYYPCLKAARFRFFQRDFTSVVEFSRVVLRYSPYNFQALRMRAGGHFGLGQTEEGCRILRGLDEAFAATSNPQTEQLCARVPWNAEERARFRAEIGI